MAKAGTVLICDVCQARNYRRPGRKRVLVQERIETRKYCPSCDQHTLHRESEVG